MTIKRLLVISSLTALLASPALAHHGWSWAEQEQMELTGTIVEVNMAPPHPSLGVEAEDGTWRVELGNPRNTKKAGFVEGSASTGDTIKATGNRSRDDSEKRMKAVQITVNGQTYNIYPGRID